MAEAVPSGSVGKGRPLTDINMDDVKYLLSLGFSKSKVAEVLGISRKTLYNKIGAYPSPEDFGSSSLTVAASQSTGVGLPKCVLQCHSLLGVMFLRCCFVLA